MKENKLDENITLHEDGIELKPTVISQFISVSYYRTSLYMYPFFKDCYRKRQNRKIFISSPCYSVRLEDDRKMADHES